MGLMFVVLVSLTAWRAYSNLSPISRQFDWENRAFSDFHNGTYLPTKAFVDGKSPYSAAVAYEYEMARETPPYSPIIFILHIPYALLPLEVSRALFFSSSIAVLGAIAFCCIKMSSLPFRWFDFFAITNLLLISRPGQQTIFTGYFTAEIVLGCFIALHFAAKRPMLSGLGLVLASVKPTFVLPLMMLMLFRRNFQSLVYGVLFCALAAGAGFGWLAMHNGVGNVVQDVAGGQEALHVDPTEMPVNTWTRTDLVGMYAKLTDWVPGDAVYLAVMVLAMSLLGVVLYKWTADQQDDDGAAGLTGAVICLAILLGIYHHAYDCLLLAVPLVGVACSQRDSSFRVVPYFWRIVVAALIMVVGFNYLSTKSAMGLLQLEPLSNVWQGVTLINGLCIAIALVILVTCMVVQLAKGKVGSNS